VLRQTIVQSTDEVSYRCHLWLYQTPSKTNEANWFSSGAS